MDSIKVNCGHCQAGFLAPLKLAGKAVKCPKCGGAIQVPEQSAPASDDLAVVLAHAVAAESSVPRAGATISCPFCLAAIPAAAAKCRHCGEFVRSGDSSPRPPNKPAPTSSTDQLSPVEIAAGILVPPLGLVLGLIWFKSGFKKAMPMLAVGGSFTVLLLIVGGIYLKSFFAPAFASNEMHNRPVDPTLRSPENFPGLPYGDYDDGQEEEDDELHSLAAPPSEEDLAQQPPPIQRAMRANVRLVAQIGRSMKIAGSGVIIRFEGADAIVLTNRHVVDVTHALTEGVESSELEDIQPVNVTFVTGETKKGKTFWIAPDKVDLALLRVPRPTTGIDLAPWREDNSVTQGEAVFAVGNPIGLGWTLTRGTVSALRRHRVGPREIQVVQTDAAISHGNSGGGLYAADGHLIGINNFIISPEHASNVGFAIRLTEARQLYPDVFSKALTP